MQAGRRSLSGLRIEREINTMEKQCVGRTLQIRATIVVAVMVVAALGPVPVTAAIDNVAFQWTSLLNVLWCPNAGFFTSSIQPQLHLAQWHALIALRSTGDCTTEEAVVGYASHKILSHYFSWAQDSSISPLLDRQLRSGKLTARQKRLAKRLGEAVAVSLIAKRSPSNEFALGAVRDALDSNPNPAVGVFRYFNGTAPHETNFLFDNLCLEKPFMIPHPLQFVKDYLGELKPPKIPSKEWDENWEGLKNVGRLNWTGRTDEMNLVANLHNYCTRVNNTMCSREVLATVTAQSALPATTSLYDSVVLLAKISVSIYDAAIVQGVIKYGYWFWRPLHAYTTGDSHHEAIPTWQSYRRTPTEAEYPSGTVSVMSAGARPLQKFFGKDVGFTIKGGGVFNCAQFVGVPIPDRHYNSVDDLVNEGKLGRMYAGAHWQKSVDDGVIVGHTVADYIEKHWTDTMPSGVLPDSSYLDIHAKLPKKSGLYSALKFDI